MRSLTKISIVSALGVALYTLENFLPIPVPWLRLGISNIAVILGLYLFGFGGACSVFLIKVLIGSLIAGRFLSPFFFFALFGGGAALLVMTASKRFLSPPITIVGVSMLGGVTHNLVQLVIAYFLFFPLKSVFLLTPLFVLFGLVSGSLIGVVSALVLKKLTREGSWHSEELVR